MNKFRVCFLRCISSSHPDLALPHGSTVLVGRGPDTRVREARCSRKQISLVADTQKGVVSVTQIGVNSSSVGGVVVGTGNTVQAGHLTKVELLSGQFEHVVMFNPPPDEDDKGTQENIENSIVNPERVTVKRKPDDKSPTNPLKKARGPRPWFSSGPGKVLSEKDGVEWREVEGGLIVRTDNNVKRLENKVAAFDIDGTIITTSSGKVFPTDINDWKILLPEIPGKLKRLVEDNFKVVFITNQAGIGKGKLSVSDFQTKISRILSKLGVPVSHVFASTSDKGYFRKPRPGVWEWLEDVQEVNRSSSFYCGDAAGREAGWQGGRKKDFSCSDRLLALNLGIKFYTPEEFFLGQKPTTKYNLPGFLPSSCSRLSQLLEPASTRLRPATTCLTLMVGIQGSGKSVVARLLEKEGCVLASNDLSGGKERTLRLVEQGLGQGRSVVVDNTHVDEEARRPYINMARRFKVPVRAFVMNTTHDHARHNNIFRELTDPSHTRIKEPLINQYRSRHVAPKLEEGFEEIVRVNFIPSFDSNEERQLYFMHLLEK